MYKAYSVIFTALSPLILQVPITPQTQSTPSDPLLDLIKLIISIGVVVFTPIAISKLNSLRSAVEEFRKSSSQNTQSVVNISQNISALNIRVLQLESDLALAVKERDEAKSVAVATQAAADVSVSYSESKVKVLEERNTTLNADLITERVINAELAGNIRDLRSKITKLEERCEMLETAGPIADAIARQLLEMNSK